MSAPRSDDSESAFGPPAESDLRADPARAPGTAAPSPSGGRLRTLALWAVLLSIPILPFLILGEDALERFLPEPTAANRLAGAGACFLLLVLDVLLPVPSSLVAIASGRILGPLGGSLLNWVGITLGHVVGFGLARYGGRPLALRLLGETGLGRASESRGRGATASLILSRPIPVLAEAVAMYAGLARIPFRRFVLLVAAANLPHAILYAMAGSRAGGSGGIWLALVALGVPTAGWALLARHDANSRA